jgi:hypothetical protein
MRKSASQIPAHKSVSRCVCVCVCVCVCGHTGQCLSFSWVLSCPALSYECVQRAWGGWKADPVDAVPCSKDDHHVLRFYNLDGEALTGCVYDSFPRPCGFVADGTLSPRCLGTVDKATLCMFTGGGGTEGH